MRTLNARFAAALRPRHKGDLPASESDRLTGGSSLLRDRDQSVNPPTP
jgi:hypothetical protein